MSYIAKPLTAVLLAMSIGASAVAANPPLRDDNPLVELESEEGLGLVDPWTPQSVRSLEDSSGMTLGLVFSDEFNDGTIDRTNKWRTVYQDRDRQVGTATIHRLWREENVWEEGGDLVIRIKEDDVCPEEPDPSIPCYSGGRLDSLGKFDLRYGRLEARIFVTWPNGKQNSFWMMPSGGNGPCTGTADDGAEIDIMEAPRQTTTYFTNVHWDGYGGCHKSASQGVPAAGLHAGYNIFAVEWTATELKFFFNGNLMRTITDTNMIPDVLEYPILSAMPFAPGVWVDGDIRTADLPVRSHVDWIRVYQ